MGGLWEAAVSGCSEPFPLMGGDDGGEAGPVRPAGGGKSDLASWLIQMRTRRKLSQAALARALGVSRPAVTQWENDVERPSYPSVLNLSIFYRVPVEVILTLAGYPSDAPSGGGAMLRPQEVMLVPIVMDPTGDAAGQAAAATAWVPYVPTDPDATPGRYFALTVEDGGLEPAVARGTDVVFDRLARPTAGKIVCYRQGAAWAVKRLVRGAGGLWVLTAGRGEVTPFDAPGVCVLGVAVYYGRNAD